MDCKNCVDCTFFKAEIQYVDRGIFFADISKAVTLNLEIKGIIKRWSEAESFSIFENYDYTN